MKIKEDKEFNKDMQILKEQVIIFYSYIEQAEDLIKKIANMRKKITVLLGEINDKYRARDSEEQLPN